MQPQNVPHMIRTVIAAYRCAGIAYSRGQTAYANDLAYGAKLIRDQLPSDIGDHHHNMIAKAESYWLRTKNLR